MVWRGELVLFSLSRAWIVELAVLLGVGFEVGVAFSLRDARGGSWVTSRILEFW